jgi:hypothetical protein
MDLMMWYAIVAGMIFSVLSFVVTVHLIRLRDAKRLVARQSNVIDDVEIARWRVVVGGPSNAEKFDELVSKITAAGYTLRLGHMIWIGGIIEDGLDSSTIPNFHPSASAPYELPSDAGLGHFRRYMVSKTDGREIDAIEHLKRGVEVNSPIAMAAYGVAKLEGRIPGETPDLAGIEYLERAVSLGFGHSTLARQLLSGTYIKQDTARALVLLRAEFDGGSITCASDFAEIYAYGLYGVEKNMQLATRWALRLAPRWRRIASWMGINQSAWTERLLRTKALATKQVDEASPWERSRAAKEMTNGLSAVRPSSFT